VRAIAAQLLGLVGSAAELSLGVGNALVRRPAHWRALHKAGAFLRDARETAGLTVAEVSTAIDLKDPEMLDLAENGKMVLPFEVLLRLAALLARNDPVPFLMQLARNYSPSLWKALEELGVARLVLHAGREHEFINVYRSRDAARRLSDEEFEKVLAFTDAAFGMALDLATLGRIPPRGQGS
jgi:transcriptional regulator with XRE-family HTH domain